MKPCQCMALHSDGKRCQRRAKDLYTYHGDNELYGWSQNGPSWVLVALCATHAGDCKTYKEVMEK